MGMVLQDRDKAANLQKAAKAHITWLVQRLQQYRPGSVFDVKIPMTTSQAAELQFVMKWANEFRDFLDEDKEDPFNCSHVIGYYNRRVQVLGVIVAFHKELAKRQQPKEHTNPHYKVIPNDTEPEKRVYAYKMVSQKLKN